MGWKRVVGEQNTYVIKATAILDITSAKEAIIPDTAAPTRPKQAKKPEKKAKVSKRSVSRKKTQPKRHMYQK